MILIPSVSIGNVPQLAMDLLIHTYGFQRVQTLDDEFLVPFLGPIDYTEGSKPQSGMSTPAQLFKLDDLYIVQLRSPPLLGAKGKFVSQLWENLRKIEEKSEQDVVIVSSANAGIAGTHGTNGISVITSENVVTTNMPDSGFTKDVAKRFEGSDVIVSWIHEGDNMLDSEKLASKLVEKLGLEPVPFKRPVSWSRLYGKEIPLGIEEGLYT